jgi:hypothetical protein
MKVMASLFRELAAPERAVEVEQVFSENRPETPGKQGVLSFTCRWLPLSHAFPLTPLAKADGVIE